MKTKTLLFALIGLAYLQACQPDEPVEEPGPELPAAEFSITEVDEATIDFESLQGGSKHSWDFGDGTTEVGKKVEHQFPGAGSYEVTLTTTTAEGDRVGTQTVTLNTTNKFLISRGWKIGEAAKDGKNFPQAIGAQYRFFRNGTYTAGDLDGFTWEFNEDETAILVNKNTTYPNTWMIDKLTTKEWQLHFTTAGVDYAYIFHPTD